MTAAQRLGSIVPLRSDAVAALLELDPFPRGLARLPAGSRIHRFKAPAPDQPCAVLYQRRSGRRQHAVTLDAEQARQAVELLTAWLAEQRGRP